MINSAAVTGDATGITGTGIGTGVFIPERPRIRRMKHPINWVPLVPDRGIYIYICTSYLGRVILEGLELSYLHGKRSDKIHT